MHEILKKFGEKKQKKKKFAVELSTHAIHEDSDQLADLQQKQEDEDDEDFDDNDNKNKKTKSKFINTN